jgi:hypothetical protein
MHELEGGQFYHVLTSRSGSGNYVIVNSFRIRNPVIKDEKFEFLN